MKYSSLKNGVFNHSIRTNNDIEAWHRRLNCRRGNLTFYKLVPVPLREANLVKTNVQASDLEGERRLRYTKIDKQLEDTWKIH